MIIKRSFALTNASPKSHRNISDASNDCIFSIVFEKLLLAFSQIENDFSSESGVVVAKCHLVWHH